MADQTLDCREALKRAIYTDLCAADNNDVPLEDYPERILRVIEASTGDHKAGEDKCKCGMRTRLVGDGCQYCNRKLARELSKEATTPDGGEAVAWQYRFNPDDGIPGPWMVAESDEIAQFQSHPKFECRPLFTRSNAHGGPLAGKYADVLAPFVAMMERELHANAGKGDRPGWLRMTPAVGMLEIYYHAAKLQKAVKDGNVDGIREYAADVANMSMMLVDVCGALTANPEELA